MADSTLQITPGAGGVYARVLQSLTVDGHATIWHRSAGISSVFSRGRFYRYLVHNRRIQEHRCRSHMGILPDPPGNDLSRVHQSHKKRDRWM